MAGGNNPPPAQPQPPPSSHRKSRWESSSTAATNKSPPSHPKKPSSSSSNNNNPSPKPSKKPNPSPKPHHPLLGPTFDLGPPPPPAYGFHMLERRTILLSDGTVRSYFALPPDYPLDPPLLPGPFPFGPPRFAPGPPHFDRDPWEPVEGSLGKRKFDEVERDGFARQRMQLLHDANVNPNGFPSRGHISPEFRGSKYVRLGGESESVSDKHLNVDQVAVKKAFFHFVKLVNENPSVKRNFLEDGKHGRIQCVACGSRSSKDFPDMHALIMHTFNSDNTDLHVDHLGLHKALCVLMGWNYAKPPDNSKAYKFLPAEEAAANRDDLILWPPLVIIHNTITGKGRDGRMEGLGNKTLDAQIKELGIVGGKTKSLYGRDGHLGVSLIKFAGDQSGVHEAIRLAEHFEKENHGRMTWARVQSVTFGKDDENNPNLVKYDEKKGEKRRVLYGYLGTAFDLEKIDFDTRKRVVIESLRDKASSR